MIVTMTANMTSRDAMNLYNMIAVAEALEKLMEKSKP